ncbi:hypothetical protein L7I36_20300, partial [Obesumbacterium proteus]|nr:hypothetical protein [Obesumbacterium proteus]
MSMLIWNKRNNSKNIILFIHGLKGGSSTWSCNEGVSFPQLISEDDDFDDCFDIACFEYFTNFTNSYGKAKNLF